MSSKRTSARAAKTNPWGEHFLTTNPKSPLVHVDLVKLLADPRAWTCLDEEEKQEIISLLPDHVHPNPDPDPEDPDTKIPPLPESFLRYDNNWRSGIRQFQVDLECGRHDPEWIRQAAQAMEERADGKFDKFKEEQFEEFWGQRQKLDWRAVAGESSTVKLANLIQHEFIKRGDVWRYCRIVGKKKTCEKIVIEKEVKVLDIKNLTLTFAVPPGRRVFLCNTYEDSISNTQTLTNANLLDNTLAAGFDCQLESVNGVIEDDNSAEKNDSYMDVDESSVVDEHHEGPMIEVSLLPSGNGLDASALQHTRDGDPDTNNTADDGSRADDEKCPSEFKRKLSAVSIPGSSPPPESCVSASASAPPDDDQQLQDVIIPNVTGPAALAGKILKIDGRAPKPPAYNAWKAFRCYRNNQDIGSLWELRQAWFLKHK
ncbi:hypothetical protein Egran_00593 [Elaphomyces granulatus]|uniref:DEUBAD domain-containing protein n=1 Tax=Elaphomyces granulatus TaxID=519963 RepID=A0A232M5D7_9EURO|nr:hypothetical protein Egran_00593 [Elaphomyces granulatus]